jgi:hypothetical protein
MVELETEVAQSTVNDQSRTECRTFDDILDPMARTPMAASHEIKEGGRQQKTLAS